MGKRAFFNYLLIDDLLERHLISFGGRRLFKELLSVCFHTKKLRNTVEYNFLVKKIGYDKNVIKTLLDELQKGKLADIIPHTEDKVGVKMYMDIKDKEAPYKDELIGRAIR